MTSSTPTQTHSNAPSSHFSRLLFHIRASSFKLVLSPLDFSFSFCPPPPPLTLKSQAFGCQWDQATARCMSVEKNGWLIQSSLLFLRQRRVISSTAKAFWCIAFMLSLAPSPLPQKSKFLWSVGEGDELHRVIQDHRGLVSAGRHTAVSHLPSPQGSCCHSSEKSSVRCQHHVQTSGESYQFVLERSVRRIKLMFHPPSFSGINKRGFVFFMILIW